MHNKSLTELEHGYALYTVLVVLRTVIVNVVGKRVIASFKLSKLAISVNNCIFCKPNDTTLHLDQYLLLQT